MNPSLVPKKDIILVSVFSLIIITVIFSISFFDTHTKIVFCDVGQGDGTYIRVFNKIDVLIDSGPNQKILMCLGKYMPFYDKTIDFAFLSHAQSDHIAGLSYVLDHYDINTVVVPIFEEKTKSYVDLKKKIRSKKIKTIIGKAGLTVKILKDSFSVILPKENIDCRGANECSQIILFQEGDYRVLFTGDASSKQLSEIANDIKNITILKIPHHGSKNGLTKNFFRLADPMVSVISVGKNNSYGHPAKETLDILKASKTKIRRTDKEGNIVFKLPN